MGIHVHEYFILVDELLKAAYEFAVHDIKLQIQVNAINYMD